MKYVYYIMDLSYLNLKSNSEMLKELGKPVPSITVDEQDFELCNFNSYCTLVNS